MKKFLIIPLALYIAFSSSATLYAVNLLGDEAKSADIEFISGVKRLSSNKDGLIDIGLPTGEDSTDGESDADGAGDTDGEESTDGESDTDSEDSTDGESNADGAGDTDGEDSTHSESNTDAGAVPDSSGASDNKNGLPIPDMENEKKNDQVHYLDSPHEDTLSDYLGSDAEYIEGESFSSMASLRIATLSVYVSGTADYNAAWDILDLINEERTKAGVHKLKMDKVVLNAAMLRAMELSVFYGHTRPNGNSCFTAWNYNGYAGENIAMGQASSQSVMEAWMNSSGHRANILSSNFQSVGIGSFFHDGRYYWVQLFDGGYTGAATNKQDKPISQQEISTLESNISLTTLYNYQDRPLTVHSDSPVEIAPYIGQLNQGAPGYNFMCILDAKSYRFTSSNSNVAVVKNGYIHALQQGTATITASIGNSYAQINVTAQPIGWVETDDATYYYRNDAPLVGWQSIGGRSYYFETALNNRGAMATGWKKISGRFYYFTPDGTQDGGKGVMETGWRTIGDKLYYFSLGDNSVHGPKGTMLQGWQTINNKYYFFGNSGAAGSGPLGMMMTGWRSIYGKIYYFQPNGTVGSGAKGVMLQGWQSLKGKY